MSKRINEIEIQIPNDREALVQEAASFEESCVSVGGLADNLGMLGVSHIRTGSLTLGARAFARLVEFWRRQKQMTVEELARRSGLDEAVIIDAEEGDTVPEPRVLHILSSVLGLSYEKLLHLTGHIEDRDQELETAAIRFAARSESMKQLSQQEELALHEFIKALSQ